MSVLIIILSVKGRGMQTMDCHTYKKRKGRKINEYRNSVTHTSSIPKTKIEVIWEPPSLEDTDFEADLEVMFRYSLVESFRTFWANLKSDQTIRPFEKPGEFPIYEDEFVVVG